MSGTRLHSRAVPATDAAPKPILLIVAHGERGGAGDDRFVRGLVKRLQCLSQYASVRMCFISKEPSLTRVFSRLPAGPVVIYPLFMSDGYFVKQAIPRSINIDCADIDKQCHSVDILTPIGLNSQLPRIVADLAKQTARNLCRPAQDFFLLLAAHGSKHDGASKHATLTVAEAIRRQNAFAGIAVGFLEEQPILGDQVTKITGPAIVVGLFVSDGMHGAVDLPESIRQSERDDVFMSASLAQSDGLSELVFSELSLVPPDQDQF